MVIISRGKTQNALLGQVTTNDDFRGRNPRTSQLTFGFAGYRLQDAIVLYIPYVYNQPNNQTTNQPPTSQPAN